MKLLFSVILVMVFTTISFGQRTVGQIEASDPDGDELTFESIEQRPAYAFGVTPDGELFISDEELLTPGDWEVDVRVTDDGVPPLSADATMFVTVMPASPATGDSTIIDSVYFYQYEQLILTEQEVIDSTWVVDSTQVLMWVDDSYWDVDTTLVNDTTIIIYTPIEAIYQTDTIPSQPEL